MARLRNPDGTMTPIAWNPEQTEDIIQRYQRGEGTITVGRLYRVEPSTINRLLRSRGVEIRPWTRHLVHTLNHGYFAKIQTEPQAYWLGFLAADGNVLPAKGRITLVQSGDNADQVQRFFDAVEATHPVRIYENNSAFPSDKGRAVGEIYSRPMIADLARYQIRPNKRGNLRWPTLPSGLYRHFLRGYSDGDGSFAVRRERPKIYLRWSVSGSYDFLESIQKYLEEVAQIPPTKVRRMSDVYGQVEYSGHRQMQRLVHLFYDGATAWMPRKRAVAAECHPEVA